MDIPLDDWKPCLGNINAMYKEMGNKFILLKIIHSQRHWGESLQNQLQRLSRLVIRGSLIYITYSILSKRDQYVHTGPFHHLAICKLEVNLVIQCYA